MQARAAGFTSIVRWSAVATVAVILLPGIRVNAQGARSIRELAALRGPQREQILVEGARLEGRLTLYGTIGLDQAQILATKFREAYPFVRSVDIVSLFGAELTARVITEHTAGRLAADVIEVSNVLGLGQMMAAGAKFVPDFTLRSESVLCDDELRIACTTAIDPMGVLWNTRLVAPDEAPQTLEDLLSPRWANGKIALVAAPNTNGFAWMGLLLRSGRLKDTYFARLGSQRPRFYQIPNLAAAAVARGEVDLSPNVPIKRFRIEKEQGAPVAWRPLSHTYVQTEAIAVFESARNPHTALLFADWYLSKAGGTELLLKFGNATPEELRKMNRSIVFLSTRLDDVKMLDAWREMWRALVMRQ